MSEFTWLPDYKANKKSKPSVQRIKFGDGYEARASFGLNTDLKTWSLRFANRETSEADEIDDFLTDKGGVESFEWTPPDADESSNFVCDEWDRVIEHAGLYTITATFREVAEP